MHHSNLPPEVLEKEGLTIKTAEELDQQASLNFASEENSLIAEALLDMLDCCETIRMDKNDSKTQQEIRQVTREICDIIIFDN